MALTASRMMPLGTEAPDFTLPDTDGNQVSLRETGPAKAYVVMFICNHCPYVIHVKEELVRLGNEYEPKAVAFFAINSNDVDNYPDDRPEKMKEDADRLGYPFPYLYDESQEVAKAYSAACTPDVFVFDSERKLVYRGQLDDSRPNSGIPVTGGDLRAALDAVLAGAKPNPEQKPSMGCNIKWKKGNEPASD